MFISLELTQDEVWVKDRNPYNKSVLTSSLRIEAIPVFRHVRANPEGFRDEDG
jgi:hypothetical protein